MKNKSWSTLNSIRRSPNKLLLSEKTFFEVNMEFNWPFSYTLTLPKLSTQLWKRARQNNNIDKQVILIIINHADNFFYYFRGDATTRIYDLIAFWIAVRGISSPFRWELFQRYLWVTYHLYIYNPGLAWVRNVIHWAFFRDKYFLFTNYYILPEKHKISINSFILTVWSDCILKSDLHQFTWIYLFALALLFLSVFLGNYSVPVVEKNIHCWERDENSFMNKKFKFVIKLPLNFYSIIITSQKLIKNPQYSSSSSEDCLVSIVCDCNPNCCCWNSSFMAWRAWANSSCCCLSSSSSASPKFSNRVLCRRRFAAACLQSFSTLIASLLKSLKPNLSKASNTCSAEIVFLFFWLQISFASELMRWMNSVQQLRISSLLSLATRMCGT